MVSGQDCPLSVNQLKDYLNWNKKSKQSTHTKKYYKGITSIFFNHYSSVLSTFYRHYRDIKNNSTVWWHCLPWAFFTLMVTFILNPAKSVPNWSSQSPPKLIKLQIIIFITTYCKINNKKNPKQTQNKPQLKYLITISAILTACSIGAFLHYISCKLV